MKKKKILCILPTIGDTKDSKRIEILKKCNFEVTAAAFERDSFISRMPPCEIIIIGKISNGNYFRRIFTMLHSVRKLRQQIRNVDLIYALSPDLAILAYLSSLGLKKPLVVDIADIREIQISDSIFGKLYRLVERIVINRSQLLIVTSEAFISEYFIKKLNSKVNNYFLLENKVDYKIPIQSSPQNQIREKIKIGYFGVLRDNWTIELLTSLVRRYPMKFEILAAGINMINKFDIESLSRDIDGFNYIGPYKSPQGLKDMYQQIDIIALFYPEKESTKEWFDAKKICRSNRFYESLYFKKPIIAFSFSQDGIYIDKHNIGMTFNDYTIDYITESLNVSLSNEQINKWTENIKRMPSETYSFMNESAELENKLTKIISTYK